MKMGMMFVTTLSPAWSLQDSVGEVNKLQVHRCAFGKMGETLRLCDLVLDLLQVGQRGRILSLRRLASPIANHGILHWNAHRVEFQRLIIHLLPVLVAGSGEYGKGFITYCKVSDKPVGLFYIAVKNVCKLI